MRERSEVEATSITDMGSKLSMRLAASLASVDIDLDDSLPAYPATRDSMAMLPAESARIGRFTVLRRLGMGGMGVVFSAYDEALDRKVAIKVLHPRANDSSRGTVRMRREAQAMARVSHPNVVQIYEVGQYEGQLFIAMEFMQGQTLDAWLVDGVEDGAPDGSADRPAQAPPRSWREILDVHVQAGRGLAAAHAAGLVHRDYKPSNVLVSSDGRARVLDFGLVCRGDGAVPEDYGAELTIESVPGRPRETMDERLSTDDVLIGTPAYMSPEQFMNHAVDARSDQFSFCVTLYQALYGTHPFASPTTAAQLLRTMQNEVAPPPPSAGVPAWLRAALLRGLRYEPGERWPSMDALLDALARDPEAAGDSESVLWQSRRGLMVGVVAFCIATVGLLLVPHHLGPGRAVTTSPPGALLVALLISLVLGGVVVIGRRSLLASRQSRQLMGCCAVICGGVVLLRTVPLFLEVPFEYGFVYSQILIVCIAAAGAITLMRSLLWVAGLWLLLVPLTIAYIEHAPGLESLALLATCAMGLRYGLRQR